MSGRFLSPSESRRLNNAATPDREKLIAAIVERMRTQHQNNQQRCYKLNKRWRTLGE